MATIDKQIFKKRLDADFVTRSLDLLGAESVEDVLTRTSRFTVDWLDISACGFWWLDKTANEFHYKLCHGDPTSVALARGVSISYAAASGISLLQETTVRDISQVVPRFHQSAWAIRLDYDDHVPGLMVILPHQSRNELYEPTASAMKEIALHTSAACRILDHLAKLSRLEDLIHHMSLVTYEDPLWDAVLDRGRTLLGCDRVSIRRINPRTAKYDDVMLIPKVRVPTDLALNEGITGLALKERRAFRVSDVTEVKEYRELWPGTLSEIAVPIVLPKSRIRVGTKVELADKPFGVLNFECPTAHAFSTFDVHCAETMAQHMARILERLEFDDKMGKLARAQREIARQRDWDTIIDHLFEGITETLGFDYIQFSLVNADTGKIQCMRTVGIPNVKEFRKETWDLTGINIQAAVVKSRQIEVPEPNDVRFNQELRIKFGLDKFVCVFVPLLAPSRNEVMGTLCGGYNRAFRENIFERDIQILRAFADFAVGALEFSRRGVVDRISHEINAPLSAVRNNVSFLKRRFKRLAPDHIDRILEDMETDGEILRYQVQQLEYVFADRYEGLASQSLQLKPVLLFKDIIFKIINQLRSMVKDYKLDPQRVTYDPADVHKVGEIMADIGKINQVIFNLFVNAIKYSESPETFRIVIGAENRTDAYIIKFADWGIGIPEELKERIFEEGFRAPAVLERSVAGSGLGLTIARRIMRSHGGDLVLHNLAKPTEFHVVLPKKISEPK